MRWQGVLPILLLLPVARAARGAEPTAKGEAWREIAPFFRPPKQFAGDFGTYRSPLVFADGRVQRAALRVLRALPEARRREAGDAAGNPAP
jgi:hypothetical protein